MNETLAFLAYAPLEVAALWLLILLALVLLLNAAGR
jgi:hypothetical protein